MKTLFLTLFLAASLALSAVDYLGLEGNVPTGWSSSAPLSMSSEHHKLGRQSIKWEWQTGSVLKINKPSGLSTAAKVYKGGMMLWVYNEKPQVKDVRFGFKDGSGAVQYYFDYHIDYKGWRACWVRFDEDMSGKKANKELTSMEVIAPSGSGTLYFDRMAFPKDRINDRLTPDKQLPFLNPAMNYNHWAALWHWESTYKYELPLPSEVNATDVEEMNSIRSRIYENIKGGALSAKRITELRNEFDDLKIARSGGKIRGRALVFKDEYLAANNDRHFEHLDAIILDLAKGWVHNKAEGFDEMFVDLLDWCYDQGLAYGSGMGTNHHYGYQFRAFPRAVFLMKDALQTHNKFDEAKAMIQYWMGVAEIRQKPTVDNFQGIVDAWNTIVEGRLIAILLDENGVRLKRNLQSFSMWMSGMTEYSVGTIGGLKPDGSGFHHGMLYANYMNGGYAGLGMLINYLGATSYRFEKAALDRMKKAFMLHTYYANHHSVPSSISGRHPIDQSIGTGSINALGYLAKAYTPVDEELAGEFMRVTKYKQHSLYTDFAALGIKEAPTPQGNKSVNYAALNLHRRAGWLVATKGFNNVVMGTEIYANNNRYGRYQSYGAVHILGSGNPVTAQASGYAQNGYDWNRYPGTTTIHLPFDLLRWAGSYPNINETSKDSEFAGAVSLQGNGVFGMVLDENDYDNYTDDFVARKSVFAFDKHIICLGSGISNSNSSSSTETTLFQTALKNKSDVIKMDGENISAFPKEGNISVSTPTALKDNVGNGFIVVEGQIKYHKMEQESRHEHNSSITRGNFAAAWLDHGTAPHNESYQYVILPQCEDKALNDFTTQLGSTATAPYSVLRREADAHIVNDKASSITAYVLFEKHTDLNAPHLAGNDHPCLVMVKESGEQRIDLSIADPLIDIGGSSLASDRVAQERKLRLTVKGWYNPAEDYPGCRIAAVEGNNTVLEFNCIHGLPYEIALLRSETPPTLGEQALKVTAPITCLPNPAAENIEIITTETIKRTDILSMSGQVLLCSKVKRKINISSLPPGSYLALVQTQNNTTSVLKFVKE